MTTPVSHPHVPVGTIRTFGVLGPKYQVGDAVRELPDGDWLVQVLMVESGETVEYKLAQLVRDPLAH